jgi:hypothetical protein
MSFGRSFIRKMPSTFSAVRWMKTPAFLQLSANIASAVASRAFGSSLPGGVCAQAASVIAASSTVASCWIRFAFMRLISRGICSRRSVLNRRPASADFLQSDVSRRSTPG